MGGIMGEGVAAQLMRDANGISVKQALAIAGLGGTALVSAGSQVKRLLDEPKGVPPYGGHGTNDAEEIRKEYEARPLPQP